MGKHISLASPHMSDEGYERAFIEDAFECNYIAPAGLNIDCFEKELATAIGVSDTAALSSGTAAGHLALKILGIGRGDIVFCQSLTFAATANPIIYEGAEPVFIDSEEETWNMSPEALETAFRKYIKIGKKPKAVIVVHLYGVPAKLDEIMEICQRYDVPLLEDAAESLGSTYKGQQTGTIGTAGVYSFNGNKIITTSGGGALVWNKEFQGISPEEALKKVHFWATQSREPFLHYEHKEIGYNYRLSNVSAGIGRGQLKVLDKRVEQKRKIYHMYKEAFKDLENVSVSPCPDEVGTKCNCWLSAIKLSDRIQPEAVIKALQKENVESRPIWKPMHLQPVFKDCDYIDSGGISEKIFSSGVCLPSDTKMTESDIERTISVIKGVLYV